MRPHTACRRVPATWCLIGALLAPGAGPAVADDATTPGSAIEAQPQASAELAAWERDANANLRAHAEALAGRGSADSKLAAFLLYPLQGPGDGTDGSGSGWPPPAHVQQWFQDATSDRTTPSLPALWLAAGRCPLGPGRCDSDAALRKLLQLDPGNGAVWLLQAEVASTRGDEAGRQRAFARAANAQRVDFYDRDVGRLLLAAGAGAELPPMPPEVASQLSAFWGMAFAASAVGWRDANLIGRLSSWGLPGLQWVVGECRPDGRAADDASHRQQCQHLLATMAEQASMVVTQIAALSASIELQPERAVVREAYRQALWQHSQVAQLIDRPGATSLSGYAREVLGNGELAAWRKLLTDARIPLVAPPDWLPDVAHQRELIQTGTRRR